MADYIDRKEFIRIQCSECDGNCESFDKCADCDADCRCEFIKDLAAIPAADVAPVVHAHWVLVPNSPGDVFAHYECSACKNRELRVRTRYCPHCGAHMDKEDKE